ncbi:UbiD family decarboxylase [Dactylosporangium sp. AC04546]|uniref:UbiD family decarboxylase n=1 Tax=Dactylosporangium sp. AC04546 TaxID=2862460 RepID=UPI001EDEC09A|nr:UbiD family decarboxylase [Dactylosporangium sp. AC04546]WVK78757.1 UbiD family decarboxylase [Dactylosporangium sp. AC04546]
MSLPGKRVPYSPLPEVDDPESTDDLRQWLRMADKLGQLRVIEGVDIEESVGRISEMLHHTEDAPAVLFDDIPGYPKGWRVLVNTLGTRPRLAATLGLPPDTSTFGVVDAWERLLNEAKPQPVRMVESGPILENVMRGDDVDLLKFPTPLWHPEDGGRYIGTGCGIITRDPDSGWVNVGAYRVMVHDRNRTGLYISPGKHGRIHRDKYFDKGEPMPVVVLAGLSPLQFVASGLEIPNGVSELEWVGGLLGHGIRCVEGEFTGLPIPADAEIAIEGFLHHDRTELEGPFGEWTGYYASASRHEPVLEVKAVYHRNDPIILGCPPEKPPYEAQRFQQYLRSGNLRRELRAAGVPDVVNAWTHSVGGCRLFNVVSIKQRYAGHARQAGLIATQCRQGAYLGRIVVVVDDDVDITDLHEVIWAVCTRADPVRDMDIIRGALSGPLDPAIHPDEKGTNSRLIIDATRPWAWRDQFPPAIGPSLEVKLQTRETWSWIMD